MAEKIHDMDEKAHTKSTIFNRLKPAKRVHLKPLSVYSRMITCDQKATPTQFCNPFINFKIELKNDGDKKRILDDSSPDEGYETPAKKPFSPNALSPDLGCFLDYSSPTATEDSMSPFAISKPALLNDTQALTSKIKQTVSCQLHSEHVECGSSTEPRDNKGGVPLSLKCEKDLLNVAPAFDCDVDDILCLNPVVTSTPLGTCAAGGPLESVNSPVESLEGDVGEAWNIGLPIFESSLCHNVTVKLNASGQSRQVSEEVKGSHTGLVTLSGDESTLDTSYETTLPIQVQVKSVIVAPKQQPSSSKPAAHPLPGLNAAKGDSSARIQRPVVLDREVERDKRLYLQSVTRHLNGAAQDVMTELLKLMSHVADQTPASYDKQWQHPSDLTRRNYQQRFQNIQPKMSLHEWQAKNGATHKRFARVPKIFERSQFP